MPIQLIKTPGHEGWQVRVGPRDNTLTRFFSWRKHGGFTASLEKARRAEAQLLPLADPLKSGKCGPKLLLKKNNTSGINGVRAYYTRNGTVAVLAIWPDRDGRLRKRAWSTQKHGLLEAVRLALEAREKGTGLDLGVTPRQAWNLMRRAIKDDTRG